ncbi:MAG: hypothetical protein ACI867_002022, partial [Glaciecola sp.]
MLVKPSTIVYVERHPPPIKVRTMATRWLND